MNSTAQKIIRAMDDRDQVESLLKMYLYSGECINTKLEHGDSLLHFASRVYSLSVMSLLVKYGADVESVNEYGRRPIHEVIDNPECVSYLVHDCHVDVNAMKRGDWTPVMIAAMKGNIEIVKLLVNAGALLNRTTKDGRTALYLAIQEGHVELSKYLIDIYPKAITQATKSGRLPTQAAAALIQEEKKDDDRSPAFVMTTYLLSHTTSSLQTLLLHRDNSGRNVLLDSAVSQNLHLLEFLLDKGADPNDVDSLGRNMIHHAAMMGHLNVLKSLQALNSDLNWNQPDTWDNWTPLMHASRQGHEFIVKYLIQKKVDQHTRDKQGRTAKDIANQWNHDGICRLLE